MNTIDKLYELSFSGLDETIKGILKTHLKYGVITTFDTLYVEKKYNKLYLEV